MTFRRHDPVDVVPGAWAEAVAALEVPPAVSAFVIDWPRRGWPALVRRRLAGERAQLVPLAVQLPQAFGRLRLALAAPVEAVTSRPAVTLERAAASAPPAWSDTIGRLLALDDRFGVPRVYGSLLWQHVTGEAFLRNGSDLDLLWRPIPAKRAALLDALAHLDGVGCPRVDGEIELDDGAGVSWRELQAARAGRIVTVAAKTLDGVALRESEAILRETVSC